MMSLLFKHSSKTLGFCARMIEWTLGPYKLSMHIFLIAYSWDTMRSLLFKHPSEIFEFHVRMIEWNLGSYMNCSFLFLFLYNLMISLNHSNIQNPWVSCKIGEATLGLENALFSFNLMMNLISLKDLKSPNSVKRVNEKGFWVVTIFLPFLFTIHYFV